MSELKIGTRVKCEVCGSEAVVITSNEPKLACCGKPMVTV
jgi:hypothetical protein